MIKNGDLSIFCRRSRHRLIDAGWYRVVALVIRQEKAVVQVLTTSSYLIINRVNHEKIASDA